MFKVSGCGQSFKIMLNIILRQNLLVLVFLLVQQLALLSNKKTQIFV